MCRAECMTEAGFYDRALMAFSIALQIYPMDIDVLKAAKRAAMLSNRDRMSDKNLFVEIVFLVFIKFFLIYQCKHAFHGWEPVLGS